MDIRNKLKTQRRVLLKVVGSIVSIIIVGCASTLMPGRNQSHSRNSNTKIDGFSRYQHSEQDFCYPVYVSNNDGPDIILMHEILGMDPAAVEFARYLVKSGYRVHLPLFFGDPNKESSFVVNVVKICIQNEMYLFRKGQPTKLTNWLRSLARAALSNSAYRGVGVIGMCLTGGFVIPMMIDKAVLAAVSAQPSLPFFSEKGIDSTNSVISSAVTGGSNAPLLSIRYQKDNLSPLAKHNSLAEFFCGGEKILKCKRYSLLELNGEGHSTLTSNTGVISDSQIFAREKVLRFFEKQLWN